MQDGFRFSWQLRVRYNEIDFQGIVYNSRYLEYVDAALTEYLRHLGFDYSELPEKHGFDPSLAKATVEFQRPASFDDLLTIFARVTRMGRTSLTMAYEIHREGSPDTVAAVEIVYVNFDKQSQAARPIPEAIRKAIEAFEGRGER